MTSGVSLRWIGHLSNDYPPDQAAVHYTIDGQSNSFSIDGLPVNSTLSQFNLEFFDTGQLSPTPHTLEVLYGGNSSTAPLILDYLIIQNGTSSSTTTSTPSFPASTRPAPATSTNPEGQGSVGAIVGGLIGGLALLVFAFFLLRRRQERQNVSTIDPTPTPFDYTPLHPLSAKSNLSSPGFSYSPYSQVPQTAQLGSHVTDGLARNGEVSSVALAMPSVTDTELPYPTNLRAVHSQRTALNLANPPISPTQTSPSDSMLSPSAQLLPPSLPHILVVEREAGVLATLKQRVLATLRPRRRRNQSDDIYLLNENIVLHADSGIRLGFSMNTTNTSAVEVPPLYSPD